MANPSITVTPGTGATLPTLAASGSTTANSSVVALPSDLQTAVGTPGAQAVTVQGSASGVALPVAAASLPLPTGAATAAGLTTINATLGTPMQQTGGSVAVIPSAAAYTNASGYLQGTVSSATIAAVGSTGGFIPGTSSITLDVTGSGVTTSAVLGVATTQIISATIAAAGAFTGTTGTYNVVGTTGTGTKFSVSCTLTNGSGITAVLGIVSGGSYTVNPTTLTAEPVSYGGLTGATLNILMGIATLTVTSGGAYAPTTAAQIAAILAASAPASVSGGGSATGVTIAPTFTGVATQVAAAAPRKKLFLQNISGSNLGYSFFSTTPAIGVPGTEVLGPGGSLEEVGNIVSNQAVYAIGSAFAAFSARYI